MISTRSRRGVTLFGMLTLLAILGLLLALLLPAVQKVREAANRMKSMNNLKQLAIAFHNYANDYNKFPVIGEGKPQANKPGSGSWAFVLLPYLEQDNLFKQIQQGNQNGDNVPVMMFYIPSRRQPGLYNQFAKCDYAGNAGTDDDPEKLKNENGIFTKAGINFASVTDGTSNTLMFGEKYLKQTDYTTGTGAGDKDSYLAGSSIHTLRSSDGEKRPPLRDGPQASNERGFGSPHAGGCNFAFTDGSARTIKYAVKGAVFNNLCDRADGNVVNQEDF